MKSVLTAEERQRVVGQLSATEPAPLLTMTEEELGNPADWHPQWRVWADEIFALRAEVQAQRLARAKAEEEIVRLKVILSGIRQACSCPDPDPVMQADGRFYCHRCSFQTGARPRSLEPERWLAERDEARRFAEAAARQYNDLLATCAENTAVTCAFCGVVYPAGTPRHGDGLLAEHIRVCEQHPMRALEAENAELRRLAGTCREFHCPPSHLINESYCGPNCRCRTCGHSRADHDAMERVLNGSPVVPRGRR